LFIQTKKASPKGDALSFLKNISQSLPQPYTPDKNRGKLCTVSRINRFPTDTPQYLQTVRHVPAELHVAL